MSFLLHEVGRRESGTTVEQSVGDTRSVTDSGIIEKSVLQRPGTSPRTQVRVIQGRLGVPRVPTATVTTSVVSLGDILFPLSQFFSLRCVYVSYRLCVLKRSYGSFDPEKILTSPKQIDTTIEFSRSGCLYSSERPRIPQWSLV